MSFQRLLLWIFQSGAWYTDNETECTAGVTDDCIRSYKKDLLDVTEQHARLFMKGVLVLSVVMCIMCYKWREIANAFIYLECAA